MAKWSYTTGKTKTISCCNKYIKYNLMHTTLSKHQYALALLKNLMQKAYR